MTTWRDRILYTNDPKTTYGDRFEFFRREVAAGRVSDVFGEALEMAVGLHQAGLDQDALGVLDELASFVSESDVAPDEWPWFLNTRGMALAGLGQYSEAETYYERMQELADQLPDEAVAKDIASTALQNRGVTALEAGDAERAVPLLKEAGQAKQELGHWVAAVDILNSLAMAIAETGDLARAEETLSNVEKLSGMLHDPRRVGAAIGNRGGLRARRGDYIGAEKDLRSALDYARAEGDQLRELYGMQGVGSALCQQGRLGEGLRWYRRAARLAQERDMVVMEQKLRRNCALTLLRMGRASEAVPEMERALRLARELNDAYRAAESQADLGALHLELGENDLAEKALTKARDEFAAIGDSGWQAAITRNLGELMLRRDALDEADLLWADAYGLLDAQPGPAAEVARRAGAAWATRGALTNAAAWLRRELDSARRFDEPSALAWRTATAGTLLNESRKNEAGLELLQESVAQYEQLSDPGQATRVRLDVATALSDLGRHDEAIAELQLCLNYAQEHADRVSRQHALANLGEVLRRTGELEQAREAIEEAGALARELGDESAIAHNLGNLGLVQFETGDTEAARRSFKAQLGLSKKLKSPRARASALGGLGNVEMASGHFRRAATYYREASDLHAGVWAVGEVEDLASLLQSLISARRYEELEAVAQRLLEVALRAHLWDKAAGLFSELARALLSQGQTTESADFYAVALRLHLVRDESAPENHIEGQSEQELNAFIYRLGIMAAHVETDLSEQERVPFYESVLAALDRNEPRLGEGVRPLLTQLREAFEDQGVFERWREEQGSDSPPKQDAP
jgi:tetratricopeptide (TPR) repeat protein